MRQRLVITLEMGKSGNAQYYMGQRLELIRRCLYDGVTHGVIAVSADSRVSGAWALDPDEEDDA
jgi:hypothetical protein